MPSETQIHRLRKDLVSTGAADGGGTGATVEGIVYVPETTAESCVSEGLAGGVGGLSGIYV